MDKCPHGYFTHSPSNRCPWCFGFDFTGNHDVVHVVGHGNGWLLRVGDAVCTSCGGPAEAGWGARSDSTASVAPLTLCYPCRSGENTREAIVRRATHTSQRGKKKQRGAKSLRMSTSHANRYDGLTWCDARKDWSQEGDGLNVIGESGPDDLDAVTCVECLRRIVTYGEQAVRQLQTCGDALPRRLK